MPGSSLPDDYGDDSELGAPRREHHTHYHNGNGNGHTSKALWLLIVGLLAIQAFMWRDQLTFQREVIDRLARVETRLGTAPQH